MRIYLFKKLGFLIISILFLSNNLQPLKASKEERNTPKNVNNLVKISSKIETSYLINTGDTLFITFVGINLFTNFYPVNPDGYIILPEIEKFNVAGKTVTSIKKELTDLYKETIIDPDINVLISNYRPVTFYLSGEVKRPGLYTLQYKRFEGIPNNKSLDDNISTKPTSSTQTSFIPPRLFAAIKQGLGFTPNANLTDIKIIRENSIGQGGGKISANIDLMDVIKTGSQKNNIVIHDGDTIFVGRSENIIREQLLEVTKSNFSPEFINVFVNGNVENAGQIKVRQGSTLYEAIASSGGNLQNTGRIEFIRFVENGKSRKNIYNFNKTISGDKKNNPVLQEGDLIIVRKNIVGKAADITRNIATPILSGYGLYSIFSDE
tara:strand:- start:5445 stop:6578 length:1134 start_codon:yes stop_codon:yes gene_type:complete